MARKKEEITLHPSLQKRKPVPERPAGIVLHDSMLTERARQARGEAEQNEVNPTVTDVIASVTGEAGKTAWTWTSGVIPRGLALGFLNAVGLVPDRTEYVHEGLREVYVLFKTIKHLQQLSKDPQYEQTLRAIMESKFERAYGVRQATWKKGDAITEEEEKYAQEFVRLALASDPKAVDETLIAELKNQTLRSALQEAKNLGLLIQEEIEVEKLARELRGGKEIVLFEVPLKVMFTAAIVLWKGRAGGVFSEWVRSLFTPSESGRRAIEVYLTAALDENGRPTDKASIKVRRAGGGRVNDLTMDPQIEWEDDPTAQQMSNTRLGRWFSSLLGIGPVVEVGVLRMSNPTIAADKEDIPLVVKKLTPGEATEGGISIFGANYSLVNAFRNRLENRSVPADLIQRAVGGIEPPEVIATDTVVEEKIASAPRGLAVQERFRQIYRNLNNVQQMRQAARQEQDGGNTSAFQQAEHLRDTARMEAIQEAEDFRMRSTAPPQQTTRRWRIPNPFSGFGSSAAKPTNVSDSVIRGVLVSPEIADKNRRIEEIKQQLKAIRRSMQAVNSDLANIDEAHSDYQNIFKQRTDLENQMRKLRTELETLQPPIKK